MRYPTLSLDLCRPWADAHIAGEDRPRGESQERGSGNRLDMESIMQTGERIADLREDTDDRDRIEGEASVLLFDALVHVDVHVLDDAGFWRYLSLAIGPFWDFILWRESKAFDERKLYLEERDSGISADTDSGESAAEAPLTYLSYVDGRKPNECVLPRMYRRIMALGGRDDPERRYRQLAGCLPDATDFWRSHVIRVKTAEAPAMTRALVRMQRDRRLLTADMRELAKRIRRVRANVVLNIYDDDEADALIEELRASIDAEKASQ